MRTLVGHSYVCFWLQRTFERNRQKSGFDPKRTLAGICQLKCLPLSALHQSYPVQPIGGLTGASALRPMIAKEVNTAGFPIDSHLLKPMARREAAIFRLWIVGPNSRAVQRFGCVCRARSPHVIAPSASLFNPVCFLRLRPISGLRQLQWEPYPSVAE